MPAAAGQRRKWPVPHARRRASGTLRRPSVRRLASSAGCETASVARPAVIRLVPGVGQPCSQTGKAPKCSRRPIAADGEREAAHTDDLVREGLALSFHWGLRAGRCA